MHKRRGVGLALLAAMMVLMGGSSAIANPTCTNDEGVTGPWFVVVGSLYVAMGWLQMEKYDVSEQAVAMARSQIEPYAGNLLALIRKRTADPAFKTSVAGAAGDLERKRSGYEGKGFILSGSQGLRVWTDVREAAAKGGDQLVALCSGTIKTVSDALSVVAARVTAKRKLTAEEVLRVSTSIQTAVLTNSYVSVVLLP